ncbi:7754_t:CDS:2 [Acaulospora morrowiae]|uniref:7754_t:CDS:1 n=1 Tax=Acaulospora morrowiae TaxID=94023 RepID=A0A9N9ABL4_9GLOM|nr:7754_t:CDS:2 [Acaulospora morrowiae]
MTDDGFALADCDRVGNFFGQDNVILAKGNQPLHREIGNIENVTEVSNDVNIFGKRGIDSNQLSDSNEYIINSKRYRLQYDESLNNSNGGHSRSDHSRSKDLSNNVTINQMDMTLHQGGCDDRASVNEVPKRSIWDPEKYRDDKGVDMRGSVLRDPVDGNHHIKNISHLSCHGSTSDDDMIPKEKIVHNETRSSTNLNNTGINIREKSFLGNFEKNVKPYSKKDENGRSNSYVGKEMGAGNKSPLQGNIEQNEKSEVKVIHQNNVINDDEKSESSESDERSESNESDEDLDSDDEHGHLVTNKTVLADHATLNKVVKNDNSDELDDNSTDSVNSSENDGDIESNEELPATNMNVDENNLTAYSKQEDNEESSSEYDDENEEDGNEIEIIFEESKEETTEDESSNSDENMRIEENSATPQKIINRGKETVSKDGSYVSGDGRSREIEVGDEVNSIQKDSSLNKETELDSRKAEDQNIPIAMVNNGDSTSENILKSNDIEVNQSLQFHDRITDQEHQSNNIPTSSVVLSDSQVDMNTKESTHSQDSNNNVFAHTGVADHVDLKNYSHDLSIQTKCPENNLDRDNDLHQNNQLVDTLGDMELDTVDKPMKFSRENEEIIEHVNNIEVENSEICNTTDKNIRMNNNDQDKFGERKSDVNRNSNNAKRFSAQDSQNTGIDALVNNLADNTNLTVEEPREYIENAQMNECERNPDGSLNDIKLNIVSKDTVDKEDASHSSKSEEDSKDNTKNSAEYSQTKKENQHRSMNSAKERDLLKPGSNAVSTSNQDSLQNRNIPTNNPIERMSKTNPPSDIISESEESDQTSSDIEYERKGDTKENRGISTELIKNKYSFNDRKMLESSSESNSDENNIVNANASDFREVASEKLLPVKKASGAQKEKILNKKTDSDTSRNFDSVKRNADNRKKENYISKRYFLDSEDSDDESRPKSEEKLNNNGEHAIDGKKKGRPKSEEKLNNNGEHAIDGKKKGRPKKLQSHENSEVTIKKKGRPKKQRIDEGSEVGTKKRGRPRKLVQSDEGHMKHSEVVLNHEFDHLQETKSDDPKVFEKNIENISKNSRPPESIDHDGSKKPEVPEMSNSHEIIEDQVKQHSKDMTKRVRRKKPRKSINDLFDNPNIYPSLYSLKDHV